MNIAPKVRPRAEQAGSISSRAFTRGRAAFDAHAGLPHTVRFVAMLTGLIDHPFHASLAERMELVDGGGEGPA